MKKPKYIQVNLSYGAMAVEDVNRFCGLVAMPCSSPNCENTIHYMVGYVIGGSAELRDREEAIKIAKHLGIDVSHFPVNTIRKVEVETLQ